MGKIDRDPDGATEVTLKIIGGSKLSPIAIDVRTRASFRCPIVRSRL